MKVRKSTILFSGLLMFFFTGALAQTNPDSLRNGWATRWRVQANAEINDNIFRLSQHQRSLMERNDSGAIVSGRFNNMKNPRDIVLSNSLEVELGTKRGLFQRSTTIAWRVDYSHYPNNPRKSHVDLEVSVSQKVSKHQKLRLQSGFTPYYFAKNFLADAIDLTGRVSDAERVYREGAYNKWDVSLMYRYEFPKWYVDFTGDVLVGYGVKTYRPPFTGRTERAFSTGLRIEAGLTTWWVVDIRYLFEPATSPISSEVLILDELDYVMDFNGDRDFADENRRTEQAVDRTHRNQSIEVKSTVKPTENLSLYVGLGFLFKEYTSQQPIDPVYRDRIDRRDGIELGLEYRILRDLDIESEYRYTMQKSNRRDDPEYLGEITDYKIKMIRSGIVWRL